MNDKYTKIKTEFQHQGVIKIGIEDLSESDQGVYVLLYDTLDITKPSKWDYWFLSLDEAFEFTMEIYGVSLDDWEDITGENQE